MLSQLRMFKIIWISVFAIMLIHGANAQDFVVIKTHSYSKFKGYILESFDSSGINLSVDGAPLYLRYSQIKSIRLKSAPAGYNPQMINGKDEFHQFQKGYYHSAGIGLISGNGHSDVSASIVNGYKFHRFLNTGLGFNYDRYENVSAIPVYLEEKGYLLEGKFVPFYFAQIGYGFTVEENNNNYYSEYDAQGGLYWKIGVGYQINFYKTALAIGIGYANQNTKAEYNGYSNYYLLSSSFYNPPAEVTEKRSLRRVDVKINLLF